MFICQSHTLINYGESGIRAHPLFCRRWSCPVCGPKRQWQLRTEATEGKPTTFLTLTVRAGQHKTPGLAAIALVKAWRNIRQQAKRELGIEKIPFLAVFEKTKRGWPHLHILCRAPFIAQRWISTKCQKYLNSPVVYIERIASTSKTARYVAKYCSKDPHIWDGVKRYWRSLDYAPKREEPETSDLPNDETVVVRRPYDLIVWERDRLGMTITEDLKGRKVRVGWWTQQVQIE